MIAPFSCRRCLGALLLVIFGPRLLEEQRAEQLAAKKLCPLLAVLHDETSTARFRFEVKAITPEKIADKDGKLFQPPADYTEIQPLPF